MTQQVCVMLYGVLCRKHETITQEVLRVPSTQQERKKKKKIELLINCLWCFHSTILHNDFFAFISGLLPNTIVMCHFIVFIPYAMIMILICIFTLFVILFKAETLLFF